MFKKTILFLLVSLFMAFSAHARLMIVINQMSADKKFPIAVPSFLSENGSPAGGLAQKMEALIQKDLKIADMYLVMDDALLPKQDRDTTTIDFGKWRALEVGALVKGIVSSASGGTQIQLKLYDVATGEMKLGKQYVIDGKNYVDAAHRFVDSIMGSLTGIRGPFESKIVAACGKNFKRRLAIYEADSARMSGGPKGSVNDISPSFSPDGKSIAFVSFANAQYPELYVDGRKLTDFMSTTITPAWMPDGKNLIIASAYSGNTELYMVNLNGKVVSQITKTPSIDLHPSVSPGGQIAFASERSGGLQIFSTSVGGGANQLTYTGYQNDQPDWSPDGSKIVFSGRDQGTFDVFVMNSDGSNIQRLTSNEGANESPTWSPDSRYIAYYSSRGGIYVMRQEGSAETLVQKSGACINLDWGPWLSKE